MTDNKLSKEEKDKSLNPEQIQVLLCQYKECLAFIRSFNSLIWQTPSITMAINTFLIIGYLGYAKCFDQKIWILITSFIFTIISIHVLRKHRFSQIAKGIEFRDIQDKLMENNLLSIKLKMETGSILEDKRYTKGKNGYDKLPEEFTACQCVTKVRAYHLLLFILIGTVIIIGLIILRLISVI